MPTQTKGLFTRQRNIDSVAGSFCRNGYPEIGGRDTTQAADVNSCAHYHHLESKETPPDVLIQQNWPELQKLFMQGLGTSMPRRAKFRTETTDRYKGPETVPTRDSRL